MTQKYQDSLSATGTTQPSQLEQAARKPSPFEMLPLLELASAALGTICGWWVGWNSNAQDITRYVITGFVVGLALPLVAVVLFAGALTAYHWRKHVLWTMERWSQHDLDGDGVQGEPGERWLLVNRQPDGSTPLENMTMAEFVRICSEKGTAWHNVWAPMERISQGEWQTKTDMLIGAGFARWKNNDHKKLGWHLLASADTIIRELGK